VPTLKTIIGSEGLPSVRPSANVREASILMAKVRKGVLVIDAEDDLVGIFTPKDLLCRVVAKGKAADLTAVSSVMTANPDTVSADLSLLDALKEMHDHKFLHLPVRESADEHSRVVGLVDVMQLVCSTAGGDGDGGTGSKGWRDFFRDALAARGNGADVSDPSDYNSSHGGHGHGGGGNGHLRRVTSRNRMGMSRDDRDSDYFPVQSTHSMRSGSYAQYDNAGPSDYAFKVRVCPSFEAFIVVVVVDPSSLGTFRWWTRTATRTASAAPPTPSSSSRWPSARNSTCCRAR
jgi:CBS domain-containing protein